MVKQLNHINLSEDNSQNLSDNSGDFIDKSKLSIDTKLVNHFNS